MVNHSLRTHKYILVIFYCYILQNMQSHRQSLYNVMTHVVLFSYPIKLNLEKNFTKEVLL